MLHVYRVCHFFLSSQPLLRTSTSRSPDSESPMDTVCGQYNISFPPGETRKILSMKKLLFLAEAAEHCKTWLLFCNTIIQVHDSDDQVVNNSKSDIQSKAASSPSAFSSAYAWSGDCYPLVGNSRLHYVLSAEPRGVGVCLGLFRGLFPQCRSFPAVLLMRQQIILWNVQLSRRKGYFTCVRCLISLSLCSSIYILTSILPIDHQGDQ